MITNWRNVMKKFFVTLFFITVIVKGFSMESLYVINVNTVIRKELFNFKPLQKSEIDDFVETVVSEGFDINSFHIDFEVLKLYTKDYELAKYINYLKSVSMVSLNSVFASEYSYGKETVKYICFDNNLVEMDSDESYKKAVENDLIVKIDDSKLKQFEELTIDDIQDDYVSNNKLKESFYDIRGSYEFMYHLIKLGFSISIGDDDPNLTIPKFKFYIEE